MSLCTPEEIAEKRRIALERLNSRKQSNLVSPKPNFLTTAPNFATNSTSNSPAQSNNAKNFMRVLQQGQQSVARSPQKARFGTQPYTKVSPFKIAASRGRDPARMHSQNDTKPITSNIKIVTCYLSMVSEQRFVLRTSEFHNKVIDVCKTIPSRIYDPEKRLWSFTLNDYGLVEERIGALAPYIILEGIPKKIMAIFTSEAEPGDSFVASCMMSITSSILSTLLPFQKEGVAFGIRKQGRLLIADEMGLGKTYQALALADLYKEEWPLLIVTTASTRESWMSHVRQLMPYVNCHHIACITASHEFFEEAKVVVCSYQMLEKCVEKLEAMHFGVLIMDESHTLKNSKAKCTKVVGKLAKKAKRLILLTGTPALSRPVELQSQLKMLDRNFLAYMDYTKRYCDGKPTAFGWDATGQSNLDELKIILYKKFMIRRTKADVLPQLAEKNRETVYLDEDLIKKHAAYKQLVKNLTQTITNNVRLKEELLIQYYSETAYIKCAAICFYLKSTIKEKIKFIVFAHHVVVMNAICECLKESKVSHVRIDGSTKHELRAKRVNQFQTKDKCRVAVLSLKACNAGLNLTSAQLIIFAELDWNPSTLAQAESRAHRIGQEGSVTCRYLLARNTADDIIWKMLHDKQEVLNKAGLFSEDLRKSENVIGPSSAGNIQKYVVKTPRKDYSNVSNSSFSGSDGEESFIKMLIKSVANDTDPETETNPNTKDSSNEFQDLLNDGDDDDFANLDF